MRHLLLTITLSLFFCIFLAAYEDNQSLYQLRIQQMTSGSIQLDGVLDELAWQNTEVAGDFWQKFPRDGVRAQKKTEVRMTYDDKFIYVGTVCYDSTNYVIQTLKRDADYWDSDGIAITLDPVNEKTYGFIFGVSPYGVQMEGLVNSSGGERVSEEWDNRWYVEVRRHADHWVAEMAIPFKTLRYEDNKNVWGINFIRNDTQSNEYHTWAPVPVEFGGVDMGYMGSLYWDEAPKAAKGNVSLIPYVTGQVTEVHEDGVRTRETDTGIGGDAKVAITSALNLDLTINPDFSQVDVDQQVTNLTRFNIFFPERRNFFLENSDIFSSFGSGSVRPFFSRTIGISEDRELLPILFGARLSGNVNKDWRIGLMNVHTDEVQVDDVTTPAQNYTAIAFQRRVLSRSVIKGIFLNRQSFEGLEPVGEDYGRNASLEFSYTSKTGRYRGWGSYNTSYKPNIDNKNYFSTLGFRYNGRIFQTSFSYVDVGTNYFADMGFLRRIENYDAERDTTIRLGYRQLFNRTEYYIYPENNSVINSHRFGFEGMLIVNPDWTFAERFNRIRYFMNFNNSSQMRFRFDVRRINLQFPFSFTGGEPLPRGNYDNYRFNFEYGSDERKRFAYNIDAAYWSQFYTGTRISLELRLFYRQQPWGNFGLGLEYNKLEFDEELGSRELFLISPRIEVNFSRNVFWTNFLQYNTQGGNFSMNSRLQWRFAPMSDVFLVYTDVYTLEDEIGDTGIFRDTFRPNNRGLVLKVNYWLTL